MEKKKKKSKKAESIIYTRKKNIFLNFIKPYPEVITPYIFTIYDYLIGIGVFLFSFFVYLHTLTPTVNLHDSGEMISASFVLGIPHPPGYPLYCLVGKIFSFIPLGNIAYRYNLFSATSASVAVMMVYFITLKIGGGRWKSEIISKKQDTLSLLASHILLILPAIIAALMLCFARIFWQQAVIAEKYTLNAMFATLIIFILLKWQEAVIIERKIKSENPNSQISNIKSQYFLYLFAFTLGLSFTHHFQTIFLVPASIFLIAIIWCKTPGLLNLNSIIKMSILFFLPIILYAYLPIRASTYPIINWGCPNTLERFIAHITAQEYTHYFSTSLATVFHRMFVEHPKFFINQFTGYLIWLGFVGLFFLYKHQIKIFIFLFLIIVSDFLHSSRYGIHNIEDYYIPAYIIFSIFIGYGVMMLMKFINEKLKPSLTPIMLTLIPCIFLLVPFISWACNRYYGDHSRNYYSYDYGRNILLPLEEEAILYVKGDTFAFPVWYLHYIENIRPDVTLIDQHSLHLDWYANQLKKRLNFEFTPQNRVKRLNEEAVQIIKRRFDAIFQSNQDRPIYLPYDETIAEGYTLVPTGICHRVFKKGTPLIEQLSAIDENLQFRHRGILDESIYKEERVISNISNYATSYNNRGSFFRDVGKYSQAIAEYKKALLADPKRVMSYYNLGMIYNDLGRTKEAISEFNKIIKLAPHNAEGYYGLGIVYQKIGEIDKAISKYRKAAELDPERDFIYVNLGTAYISKGMLEEAVSAFQKAIALTPQNIPALYNLGIAYSQLGKRVEAITAFQRVLAIDPNYAPARNSLSALQK